MIKYLYLVVLIRFFQILSNSLLPEPWDYIVWDLVNLTIPVILLAYLYKLFPVIQLKQKIFIVFIGLMTLWIITDYCILIVVENFYEVYRLRMVVLYVFIALFGLMGANIFFKAYVSISDEYATDGCYMVYLRPRKLQEFLIAQFTAPYGQSRLVIHGREFTFKKGTMIERPHKYRSKFIYKRIDNVYLDDARKLVDERWSPWNNCFTVFNRFKIWKNGT